MSTDNHPFDRAVALEPTAHADRFLGHVSQDYWNMVGPYGGITAATLVRAVQQHGACLGEPLSLTVNYAAALGAGDFEVEARPARTNRSTQHWQITVTQAGAVVTTGTAITAVRRATWSGTGLPMPAVPAPGDVPRAHMGPARLPWLERYDMRFIEGGLPQEWDGRESDSLTRLWVRDEPARALDFCSLAALADVFFPRVWLRRARHTPAGTVSITVYFHAGREELAAAGTGHLLAQARGQEFRNGFCDQSAQLWSEAGTMLATTNQVVYFKE